MREDIPSVCCDLEALKQESKARSRSEVQGLGWAAGVFVVPFPWVHCSWLTSDPL